MIDLRNIFKSSGQYKNREQIILRDYLALERTKLANERTLLSYIRSSLYLLIGGLALLKLKDFERINYLGYLSLILTVLFLIIGIYRFRKLNNQLITYYNQIKEIEEQKL
jgi:putative membrane protein